MTGVVLAPLGEYDRSICAATAMRPVGTVSIATCYCFIVCRLCAIPEGCTDSIHTAWRDENASHFVGEFFGSQLYPLPKFHENSSISVSYSAHKQTNTDRNIASAEVWRRQ